MNGTRRGDYWCILQVSGLSNIHITMTELKGKKVLQTALNGKSQISSSYHEISRYFFCFDSGEKPLRLFLSIIANYLGTAI